MTEKWLAFWVLQKSLGLLASELAGAYHKIIDLVFVYVLGLMNRSGVKHFFLNSTIYYMELGGRPW